MIKSLKGKVSLLCGSLVLLIALLGIYSLFNMYQISRAVDSLIITNYNSIQRLRQMDEALYAQDAALLMSGLTLAVPWTISSASKRQAFTQSPKPAQP